METDPQRHSDFAVLVLVFAEAANCREEWKLALKEWNIIESKQVKEWQEPARKQGRQEGRLETLLVILQDKSGTLPADLPTHLQSIGDADVLKRILLNAMRAGSLDDFQLQMPNGSMK